MWLEEVDVGCGMDDGREIEVEQVEGMGAVVGCTKPKEENHNNT